MLENLGQEATILLVFNFPQKHHPDFPGISVEVLIKRRAERTVSCTSKFLFQLQDRFNEPLLEVLGCWRKKMEDIENGGNNLHLFILFNQGEGYPLKDIWL